MRKRVPGSGTAAGALPSPIGTPPIVVPDIAKPVSSAVSPKFETPNLIV
jgi:hypothetical protein